MNLRVSTISSFTVATNFPAHLEGAVREPRDLFDYLVERVSIETDPETEFQIGGDPGGKRCKVRVGLSPEPIRLRGLLCASARVIDESARRRGPLGRALVRDLARERQRRQRGTDPPRRSHLRHRSPVPGRCFASSKSGRLAEHSAGAMSSCSPRLRSRAPLRTRAAAGDATRSDAEGADSLALAATGEGRGALAGPRAGVVCGEDGCRPCQAEATAQVVVGSPSDAGR